MVTPFKKGVFFLLRSQVFFIKGQHHPKSVFNSGPKVRPDLNKNPDFQEVFYSGFPLPNGKQQGGAFGAAPLGFVVFHLAVETRIKNKWKSVFLLRSGPTFGPKLKTDFGWCGPSIKPPGALNKKHIFLFELTISVPSHIINVP